MASRTAALSQWLFASNLIVCQIVLANAIGAHANDETYDHYLRPKCLDIADTAICSGISIQVPQLPMLFNSSADLGAFLVRNLNATSKAVQEICGPSLSLDVLVLPACKAFTCANAAKMLITSTEDEGRLRQLFSHCTSPAPVFTPCRSVCEEAVQEGNAYIDQKCHGNDTAKELAKAHRFMCTSYSDADCTDFLADDMPSTAPNTKWNAHSAFPLIGIILAFFA